MTASTPDRFRGVLVPASTPFKADLTPDSARFNRFCAWLLDEGADVEQEASNPLYRGNFSPLLQACRHGRLDTARLLLDRGAAVDRVMYGGTPLIIACGAANNTASEHNIDVVRLLLDRGADVNHTVAGGTPLLSALGWPDAVRLLLDRGARVDYGSLVLHAVSMRGRLNNDDAEIAHKGHTVPL